MKKVLDVGQCSMDHGSIRWLIERSFSAQVEQAHDADEALAALRAQRFDLVLVNRKLDVDSSDGLELIRRIKADRQLAATPVMLVTNYPQYQQQAIAEGALPGFGKADLSEASTRERLAAALEE